MFFFYFAAILHRLRVGCATWEFRIRSPHFRFLNLSISLNGGINVSCIFLLFSFLFGNYTVGPRNPYHKKLISASDIAFYSTRLIRWCVHDSLFFLLTIFDVVNLSAAPFHLSHSRSKYVFMYPRSEQVVLVEYSYGRLCVSGELCGSPISIWYPCCKSARPNARAHKAINRYEACCAKIIKCSGMDDGGLTFYYIIRCVRYLLVFVYGIRHFSTFIR